MAAESLWCPDVHPPGDGANHFVQMDAPDEMNAKVLEFLSTA